MGRIFAAATVAVALAVGFATPSARADTVVFDTYAQALDKAAPALAAALRQRGLGEGASIGIARFRARTADVTCEPLSSLLAEGLRKAFLTFNDTFRLGFDVAASVDPRTVPVLGGGRWHRGAGGEVVLSLVVGDARSEALSTLAMTDVAFKADSLPRDARSCLLDFTDVEKEVTLRDPAKVREAPSSLGREIMTLAKGTKVWVAARVTTPGVGDWYVVDLDVDRDLPASMRRQRGFAHGVLAGGGVAAPAAANALRDRVAGALRRYHAETSPLPLAFVFTDVAARPLGDGVELAFSGAALEFPGEPRAELGTLTARITPLDSGRSTVVVDLPATVTLTPSPSEPSFGRCAVTSTGRSVSGVWNDGLDGFEALSIAIDGLRSACDGATVYSLGRLALAVRSDDAGGGRRDEKATLDLSGFQMPRVAGVDGDSIAFRSLAVRLGKSGIDAAQRRTHLLSLVGDSFPIHLPFVAAPVELFMTPDAGGLFGTLGGLGGVIDALDAEIAVTGLTGSIDGGVLRFADGGVRLGIKTRRVAEGRMLAELDAAQSGRISTGDWADLSGATLRVDAAIPMGAGEPTADPLTFLRATDLAIKRLAVGFDRGSIALSGTLDGDRAGRRDDALPWRGRLDVDIRDAAHLVRALAHGKIASGAMAAEGIDAFFRQTAATVGLRAVGDDVSGRLAITVRPDGQPLINDSIGLEDYLNALDAIGERPGADGKTAFIVASGPVNLRATAGMDGDVVARLLPGTRVAVFEDSGEWTQVVVDREGFDTATGFVSRRFVADGPPAPRRDGVAPASGPFAAGARFRDCADCPEMVALPAGTFRMGDGAGDGPFTARPAHTVTIGRPFALGRTEVTRRQWDACVADGGCDGRQLGEREPNDGDLPAANISWTNAQAFVAWLNRKTGMAYRLPSEAEWEYAARAGAATRYPWGDALDPAAGRFGREGGPVAVGSFPANRFGLHDMIGNVDEFTADCWHESYDGAPTDGGAWTALGNCRDRTTRGGNWASTEPVVAGRSAMAVRYPAFTTGFRVARKL